MAGTNHHHHQSKNLSRESLANFSTASNALNDPTKKGGDLNKSDIHRKGAMRTFHNHYHNKNNHNNMSSPPPPCSLYHASVPTVSFDHSLPPPPTSKCTKRKQSTMEATATTAATRTTTTTSTTSDVKKKNSSFLGKQHAAFKRKDSPFVRTSVEASSSKKQKASTVTAPCANVAPAQYPYGHYPHYPYYYPYYPPPANMVAAPPPPPPGYTWPYPVAPPGYAPYYPPHYYQPRHPSATPQPVSLSNKHRDKSKEHKSSAPPSTTGTTTSRTQKASTHKTHGPDTIPSSTVAARPSSFESTAKFPPRDITIHTLHDGPYNHTLASHHTSSSSSPTTVETKIDRRERKNAQSRMRAAKLKESIHIIQAKRPQDRTLEEIRKLETYEERRRRKNGRSRERALERKARFEEISAKPESEWTVEEKDFMKETLTAKFKKNEGDRLRRKRMREGGSSSGSVSVSSCADMSSRATLRHSYSRAFAGVASASCASFKGEGLHRGGVASASVPLTPKNEMELYEDDGFARFFDLSPRREEEEVVGAGYDKDIMSHFIFPSPSEDEDRLVQSPTLELCAETSILDQNLEDIILSPHFATPRATVSSDDDAGEEIQGASVTFSPSTSPLTLRLLDLPRRSKPEENLYDDAFCTDWRGFGDMDDSNNQHEPIAVSFSMDTI